MTAWTTLLNALFIPGKPILGSTGAALRDNLAATMEGAAGAPYAQVGWHPYNSLAVGDANTGVIYDFAVNGAVSSIISPDFIDGYEYRMIYQGLAVSAGSPVLNIAVYRETSAAYATADQIDTLFPAGIDGVIVFNRPRDIGRTFVYDVIGKVTRGSNANVTSTPASFGLKHSTAQKVLRVQISSASSINGGKITMYRRRVF